MMRLAVIGGGFSAAALLLALRQHACTATWQVTVFEPRPRLGAGLAYSPWEHDGWGPLLNVPAGRMGPCRGDEEAFARWWEGRGGSAKAFAPRALYGDYLAEQLKDAPAEHVRRAVTGLQYGGSEWQLQLDDGQQALADAVVLAVGHESRRAPPGRWCEGGWIEDPWAEPAVLDTLAPDARVLLIGSGLTAIDTWQRLGRLGARHVTMVSRHGWLPQPHRELDAPPPQGLLPDTVLAQAKDSLSMLRELRHLLQHAGDEGHDWRDLFADLRRHTPRIWQQLPVQEQRRALRHLQSLWDSHRHRLAPSVARAVAQARQDGRLRVLAGRVIDSTADRGQWHVRLSHRGGGKASLPVDAVVNCTGPTAVSCATADALLAQGLRAGWLQRHANGLGPACDAQGRLLDARGAPQGRLFQLGPGLRARDWEATAVPELREHAAALASTLAQLAA